MNDVLIKKTYQQHSYTEEQLEVVSKLRRAYSEVDTLVADECKASRETSKALTDLENSMMWAIKSLFVNF